jgi:DNA topoisomerase-3
MKPMLNPALTASWEKGLTGVAEGTISEKEYMDKLDDFVSKRTNLVKQNDYRNLLRSRFDYVSMNYKKTESKKTTRKKKEAKTTEE